MKRTRVSKSISPPESSSAKTESVPKPSAGSSKSSQTDAKLLKTSNGTNDGEMAKSRSINARCELIEFFSGIYHAATADVNFVFNVDGNEELVPAHKCILAFHSPVFRKMFYGSEQKKEGDDIKVPDTTVDSFVDFIESLYSWMMIRHPLESDSKIAPLLDLAHKYEVNWLEDRCKGILSEIVKKDVQAVLWVLPSVERYNYGELDQLCNQSFCEHGNALIQSPNFFECKANVVGKILRTNFVNRNEVKVFEKCIECAKRKCEETKLDPESPENIRAQLGDCFNLIRFGSMSAQQFVQCLTISTKIFTHDEIQGFASSLASIAPCKEPQQPSKDVRTETSQTFVIKSSLLEFNSVSNVSKLIADQTTADVVLVLKNEQNQETERISAHKCILAGQCEVFADQFERRLSKEVSIVPVSADTFRMFLRLIYTFSCSQQEIVMKNIADENVATILSLVTRYNADRIWFYYNLYLARILNQSNVARHFEWALRFSMDFLKAKCIDFLKEDKAEVLLDGSSFYSISHETLKELLQLNFCKDAYKMVMACIKWAQIYCRNNRIDEKNRKNLGIALSSAFDLVPFSALDSTAFVGILTNYGGMFTGEEIQNIFQKISSTPTASI